MSTTMPAELRRALRDFCLGSFFALAAAVEEGASVQVSLEEHRSSGGPTLYEYRPLLGEFVQDRARQLGAREDAVAALALLKDEPAAGIFARAHAGAHVGEDEALRRTILLPLVADIAGRCGGFDWDDVAFDNGCDELAAHLYGAARPYRAVAPLVGLCAAAPYELAPDVVVRELEPGELPRLEQAGLALPMRFGLEVDRTHVLELSVALSADQPLLPDAPAACALAVSALRLCLAGPVGAGPELAEWLDGRAYGRRPIVGAVAPADADDEPARLDPFRGALAAKLLARLREGEPALVAAVAAWRRADSVDGPAVGQALVEALTALLGRDDGPWAAAIRTAALLGETGGERGAIHEALLAAARGHEVDLDVRELVRRAIVEAAVHGDPPRLVADIDESLLGLAPRPTLRLRARAG